VLSSVICFQYGADVYSYNPCDILGRAYNYSPLLLGLSLFHVGYDWVRPGGIALILLFIVALASLPPPRGAGAWALTLLASFSTMTLFALERGNADVVLFLLAVAAGHLLRVRAARPLAYGAMILAALLKLYPIALLFVAVRERKAALITVAAASFAALAALAAIFPRPLAEMVRRVPVGPYYTDLFGAKNLPDGMTALIAPLFGANYFAGGPIVILAWLLWAALLAACGRRALGLAADPALRRRFAEPVAPETIFLALGAAVIVGCFFGAQNVGYRGIFFLLVLPGLLRLARDRQAPHRRRLWRSAAMIVFLMWGEMMREAIDNTAAFYHVTEPVAPVRVAFWLGRELAWWYVVATLAGLLLCLAANSELGAAVMRRLTPNRRQALS
jgi:hypothetical protein